MILRFGLRCCLVCFGMGVGVLPGGRAAAATGVSRLPAPGVHVALVATGARVVTGPHDALLEPASGRGQINGDLLEDQGPARRTLPLPAGCVPGLLSPSSALLSCIGSPPEVLDNVTTGAVRPLSLPSLPFGIGVYWAAFSYVQDPTNEHTNVLVRYENLRTGAQVADPLVPGDRKTVSLNRPSLIAPLCSPVRVPSMVQGGTGYTTDGGVQMLGSVALSVGSYSNEAPHFGSPLIRLIHCGSGRSTTIDRGDTPFAANRRVVVFATPHGDLQGYTLPSERRFTLTLPKTFTPGFTPQLTNRFLYLETGQDRPSVWRVPISEIEQVNDSQPANSRRR